MEMEEDINSLEQEIKMLEDSKLEMRKEFKFLELIPVQRASPPIPSSLPPPPSPAILVFIYFIFTTLI
jgi:hypothetical protein